VVTQHRVFFQIIADGVAKDKKLAARNVPLEERNQNWLPKLDEVRTCLVAEALR